MANKKFYACVYTRLSQDDGDKSESDSIVNQRALIKDFIKSHPDITIVSEKTDDGYSGVNFDRPAFKEMMEEIRKGTVNCVIVKDLSRLGRNYIESGNYIERVFPLLEVRFIAINDNYDSADRKQSDSLIVPFKNLINDAYCKDISVKIRTQLEVRRKNGEYTGAYVVYGYVKDGENRGKIIPDPYAASVVRQMFQWKIQGMSQAKIADKLNQQGILCPMEYKLAKGENIQTHFRVHKKAKWSASMITRILENEIYTGNLVQGKMRTPNYKVKKMVKVDESEWIRVENTHEAIVDKELFELVQNILQRDIRSAPNSDVVYPFSGYLKCADCKQNVIRKTEHSKGEKYFGYVCSSYKRGGACTTHSIREEVLKEGVLRAIQSQIAMVLEMEKFIQQIKDLPEEQRNLFDYESQIVKLEEEVQRNQKFKLRLYENLQEGVIGQEEYFLFRKSYTDRIEKLKKSIEALQEEQVVNVKEGNLAWMETFKKYKNISAIERQVVVELIDRIYVYEGNRIEVKFRYQDAWERMVRIYGKKK